MKLRFTKGQKVTAKNWRGVFTVTTYCSVGNDYMYQITDEQGNETWVNHHVISDINEPPPAGAQIAMF